MHVVEDVAHLIAPVIRRPRTSREACVEEKGYLISRKSPLIKLCVLESVGSGEHSRDHVNGGISSMKGSYGSELSRERGQEALNVVPVDMCTARKYTDSYLSNYFYDSRLSVHLCYFVQSTISSFHLLSSSSSLL